MKLNREIIENLNNTLAENGVKWSYEISNESTYAPVASRTIADRNGWLDSCIINCTDEYENWLIDWFKKNYDITIRFNNTHTSFWSTDIS